MTALTRDQKKHIFREFFYERTCVHDPTAYKRVVEAFLMKDDADKIALLSGPDDALFCRDKGDHPIRRF